MEIKFVKCKIKSQQEQDFVDTLTQRITELVKLHNLPILRIRYTRQPLSFGNSAGDYHVYRYSNPEYYEFYVNLAYANLSSDGIKYLEYKMLCGALYWTVKKDIVGVDVTEEDCSAYALKYSFVNDRKLRAGLAFRKYVDKIAGTNFAFEDRHRERELIHQANNK